MFVVVFHVHVQLRILTKSGVVRIAKEHVDTIGIKYDAKLFVLFGDEEDADCGRLWLQHICRE